MPTAETVYSLALANLPSTAIVSNENSAAGSRDSRLEKDNSRFAVSILDEFLMHDSSSHETKRKEDSDRGLDKWELRISKRKEDKQLNNTELKEPNAWEANSTSLLDEFI